MPTDQEPVGLNKDQFLSKQYSLSSSSVYNVYPADRTVYTSTTFSFTFMNVGLRIRTHHS
jgi:hypothetical protein